VCESFALVCELPYYTSRMLADTSPAGTSRRDAVLAGVGRAEAVHQECARAFGAIATRAPDHRLTRSITDYLRKTPKRLAAERAHAAEAEYAREATRAEALDATTCRVFYHMLYLGEVYRVAGMVDAAALAADLRTRIAGIAAEVERESALRVLPLRPLVAVQAGAALLALDAG
jgi:hypothetical protein